MSPRPPSGTTPQLPAFLHGTGDRDHGVDHSLRALARLEAEAAEARARERAARERAAELDRANEALNRSVAQLTSHDSLDVFLHAVLREISEVSGAAAAKLFAHDPGSDTLRLIAMVMDGEVLDLDSDPRVEVWRTPVPASLTGGWDRMLAHCPIWMDADAPSAAVWPEARAWHAAQGHRTLAVFPLIVGETVTGGLALAFPGHERPTEERVRICGNLAGQAALALRFTGLAAEAKQAALLSAREEAARERARELADHNAELRRRDRLLDALVRASTLLQESDDFDAAVPGALGVLGEAAGMDRVALLEFVDEEGRPGLDRWRVSYEWCAPGAPHGLPGCQGGSFADLPEWRRRIAAGEPMLEARTRDLPDPAFREAMAAIGVRYNLTVAISIDGAARGGLTMDDCTTDRPRTDAEKAVFAAAARAFGLAVRRRRALQREAEAERRLLVEREQAAIRRGVALARAGTALQRAVDAVSRADDLDAFVPAVLDIVAGTFSAQSCAYYEFGGDGTVFLRYWYVDGRTRRPHELLEIDGERFGMMRQLALGFRAPDEYLGQSPCCPQRSCVFVDHAAGTCMPEWDAFARREGWEAELHVPLFVDGAPDAEVVIFRGAAEHYTPDEVALAETLGKQLALAVAAARMAGKAREAAVASERGRAAEERAAALARVNDALERRGRLLAAVSDVSRLLLCTGDPSTVFPRAIALLGSAAGVDRAGMMVNRPPDAGSRRGYGELVAEWTAPGVPRQSDHPESRVINWDDAGEEAFARWIGGDAVIVTEDLPEPIRGTQAAVGIHTQVGFPIFIGHEFWGSIGFDDCTGGREWDEGELSALRVAATTIAGAVQRSRAEAAVVAERERAAEELARANRALVSSLDTLAGEADLDHFLVAVLRRIREVSGAWSAHLFRYREGEGTLALHVAVRGDGDFFGPAPGDPPLFHAPIPVDHSPGWAYMLETREILVSDVDGHRDFFWPEAVAWHDEHGHTALAALTLVAAGSPVGALALAFRDGGNLEATQAELVQTLLTQLTLALRLTSLAETAREAAVAVEREKAVQERAAELVRANQALSGSLARLGDGVDAEAFLRRVLQTVTAQFSAPSSTLWLYDMERMEAHLHLVCVGDRVVPGADSQHPNAHAPAPIDPGLLGHLRASADRRVHVTDVEDPSISDTQRAHLQACGARAMIGVPLLLGERVLGLISVRIPGERPIRHEEREVAQALAHQATLALQLSRLAREARDAAVLAERNRIAREIHDTLAQGLTGIIFGLEGALRGAAETPEPVRRQVNAALEVARGSLAEARRSLWALRPVPLAAEGLEGGLRRLVEQHRDGAVEIALEVAGDGGVHLPHAEAELGLLRVAQEAVSNAIRHAGASRIVVRLEESDGEVRLTVSDDGRGFDPEALSAGQSFGITGMRERAARAGGRIEISGAPGRGTIVSVRVAASPG